MPSVPTPSKAGIIEDESGDRHIPSSTRADGSKRKEIKIRPGYKPPEDVEVYKNQTAEGFRSRGKGGVPGADGLKDEEPASTPSNTKNSKRREARRKAAATASIPPTNPGTEASVETNWRQPATNQAEVGETVDPEVEREKKARNLKKKLKQAKDLKERKEGGAALLPEQFAKVIKINELIRELDALGFDSEGEPKETLVAKAKEL
jgi:partner of Y14 and mago